MLKDETKNIQIKINDDKLAGSYANAMHVSHTKDEFVLDFINMFPPQGVVTSRVITNPSHMKRVLRALSENISKYEAQYGTIEEGEHLPLEDIKFN